MQRLAWSVPAVVLVLVALVVGLPPDGRASACSCVGLGEMEAYDLADTVFVGTLRTVITDDLPVFGSDDPARFVFAVSEVYKGEVFERQSVVTPRSGASCGLEVSGSGSIVVFARSARLAIGEPDGLIPADELASGEVSSHLCSGTRMIGSNPLPARFGEPQAPLPGSSGVGGGASATAVVVIGGIAIGVVAVAGAGLVIGRRRAAR